jgi:hypothetical protein
VTHLPGRSSPAAVLRGACTPSGVLSILWSLFAGGYRDAEGFLQSQACLPLVAGMALLWIAGSLGRPWRRAGLWLGLAFVGHAAALQLILAGPSIHYQHYADPSRLLSGANAVPAVVLAFQLVAVSLAVVRARQSLAAWLRKNFRVWQLALIGLLLWSSSSAPSRDISFYVYELSLASILALVNLANVVLVVVSLPASTRRAIHQRIESMLRAKGKTASTPAMDPFPLIAALWVVVVAAILAVVSYERHPHVPDEVTYLYHARYFAAGRLTMPASPVPEAFDVDIMTYEPDRWYAPTLPGWPAILAVGAAANIPWLINPLLAGLGIILAYALVRQMYDRTTARLVVVLLSLSPWYVFLAMSFMSHSAVLVGALGAALAMMRYLRTGKLGWTFLAGCLVGASSLIRNMDGLVIGAVLGLVLLVASRFRVPAVAAFGAGSLLVGALILPYNAHLTGDAMTSPLMTFWERDYPTGSNALGFGPDRGWEWGGLDPFPGHGPRDVLVNTALNVSSVNFELFGWSTGSLILIILFVLWRRFDRRDWIMIALILAVVASYSAYWFSGGPDFGARYWFLVILPCAVLAVRGAEALAERLGHQGFSVVVTGMLILSLSAFVNVFPWRAIDKYHHYRGMRPDIRDLDRRYDFGPSLVLIRGNRHPDYASAFPYNPLDFRESRPIFAWDRSPEVRARLLTAYPERPVWTVEGPTVTGRGFRVVERPPTRVGR